MNKADTTVTGNIVDSPRLNRTGTGTPVANFRIASTRRRFDQASQSWVDGNTLYVDVECFGELAGNLTRSLVKGDSVIVSGDLYTNEWESEAGKRSTVRLKADSIGPDLTRWAVDVRRTRRTEDVPAPTDDLSQRATEYQHELEPSAVSVDDAAADGSVRELVDSRR
ncbi:single-stranded DNA-binding protein [Modestobacter sp. I12A-02628]|uniref:Single-stranded DNA-binding protein n=1 Tax=Goekera deserti TaxID=2497753 RepID=A0A7K3WBE6_9ACTN|nr:single-stranded DNA-binding protein [Goekera deserti]MPQ98217.1 single-stranded DNA-binding protein [Goekera deserti]NDI48043.1 single-stranded DNA-binding protein [Goekera deserti]NEL53791.1 single-stranded DNA-binding protein [Goekera deserti]